MFAPRYGFVLTLLWILLSPSSYSVADDSLVAESLLPAECIVAVRFDGLKRHEAALASTALGRLLDGELAPLIADLKQRVLDALGPDVVAGKLLEGASPEELAMLAADAKRLPVLFDLLHENGVLAGLQIAAGGVPSGQLTLVFPDVNDEKRAALQAALRLISRVAEIELTEETHADRKLTQGALPGGVGKLACWQEGEHFVVTLGMLPPSATIDLAEGRAKRLSDSPAWRQLAAFDEYPTYARGIADTERLQRILVQYVPPAEGILAQLGVDGVNQVSFYAGFEGAYQRTTVAVATSGERRGILKLHTDGPTLDLDRVAGLPPDASSILLVQASPGPTYEYAVETIEKLLAVTDPGVVEAFSRQRKEFEEAVGGPKFQQVLGSLGPTAAVFMEPASGVPFFGVSAMIEIRDPKELAAVQEDVLEALGRATRDIFDLQQRKYRDVTMHVLRSKESYFPVSPTIAVCDKWLLIGVSSQAVQGAIYRLRTKAATLEWSPELRARIESVANKSSTAQPSSAKTSKVVFISQTDPRPTVRVILGVLPFYAQFLGSVLDEDGPFDGFDMTLIPSAQAVVDPLSVNFAIGSDDGATLRYDTYSTLPMPIDLSSLGVILGSGIAF